MRSAAFALALVLAIASVGAESRSGGGAARSQERSSAPNASASLDYEFFKTQVQPIFLARRAGHARCISCHTSGTPLRLEPLAAGSTTWSEEQSRRNFEAVKRVVVPGSLKSRLLVHPLDEHAAAISITTAASTGGRRTIQSGRR